MPKVRVILGSKSDVEICQPIQDVLAEFGVQYDFHISSAHRKPLETASLAQNAAAEGVEVIIACAGMAAHLPGVIASYTHLPVIGVPLASKTMGGIDALYSVVQMPPGVPVATVAINGAKNAALLAIQILALKDEALKQKFIEYKKAL
ncbi:MAG TPA: 5-(carboxyamino)imidazole ribonucleotide mutase [Candidatus Cloacimonadota bacterium]|nr:5-(carboxyamino)imidazole ribonucleotide mutase [Candidatus Cloacimonadota bacterium]